MMSIENYSVQTPAGFIDRLAVRKRKTMYGLFTQYFGPHTIEKVLDVGVTADQTARSSNFFEDYFPDKNKIIALSNQNCHFLEKRYPGLQFQLGDARALPFPDASIDVVFSSAVIEHIGNQRQQQQMLAECVRVAKKGVFITTPNRWHPIEVHTLLPLLHWLPKPWHRKFLSLLNYKFYADEQNLNLLDRNRLRRFCAGLPIQTFVIKSIYTMGFASNLILVIRK